MDLGWVAKNNSKEVISIVIAMLGNDPFNVVHFLCMSNGIYPDNRGKSDLGVYVYNIKECALSQGNNSRGIIIKLNHV